MASETTCQKLYDAIRAVDLVTVTDLLNLVDVGTVGELAWPAGDPPLVLAAKTGHEVSLLRELVNHRCHVNASSATGETALHCVAGLWEPSTIHDAIHLLLQAGSDPRQTDNLRRQLPLHLLAKRCGAGGKRTSVTGLPNSMVDALRLLAESGCDVNARDHKSRTPLHLLASSHCQSPEPYRILLRHGADVGLQNDRGETPLVEAIECGALFAAELLLRETHSSPQNNSLLTRCLSIVTEEPANRNSLEQPLCNKGQLIKETKNTDNQNNNEEQPQNNVEQPLSNGEQPKTVNSIDKEPSSDDKQNQKSLEQSDIKLNKSEQNKNTSEQTRNTSDQLQINGENKNKVETNVIEEQLIHSSRSTNSKQNDDVQPYKQPAVWLMRSTLYGETALHVAARKDHAVLVELMLRVNHEPELTGARDLNGDTALHLAAGRGHVEVVRQLVSCADINARNRKGLTPLHVAVESGFIPVVKLLLERPACDVLARTSDERRSSPLDLAQHEYRRRSQPEMSLLLTREAERRNLPVR